MDARTDFYVLNKVYCSTKQRFALNLFGGSSDIFDDIVNKSAYETNTFSLGFVIVVEKFS